MAGDQTTNIKDLLQQVCAFGEAGSERRRFERKRMLWAAAVDVNGQRFEGSIIDLSPGGARLKFDAPLAKGDELTLVMKQLEELGAKVIWQRAGETGVQFLVAPAEVAARVKDRLDIDLPLPAQAAASEPLATPSAAPSPPVADPAPEAAPAAPAGKRLGRIAVLAAIGVVALGSVVGGGVVVAGVMSGSPHREELPPPRAVITAGAVGQHSCPSLLRRLDHVTNQVDFQLAAAAAAQAKCLDNPAPAANAEAPAGDGAKPKGH